MLLCVIPTSSTALLALGTIDMFSFLQQSIPWIFGMGTILAIFSKYQMDRERDRRFERKVREEELELRRMEQTILFEKERKVREESDGSLGKGFILLEMDEDKKTLFHDVLKGFEDYAKLKGYDIRFSVDGSEPNRIAFKFTILNTGFTVSPQQVKRDLQEYIEKVERGDQLDDLPVMLSEPEHQFVLLRMRNRINLLHCTTKAQTNVIQFYENILKDVSSRAISQGPNFYLQQGGAMNHTNYSAVNSSQIAQGQQNRLIGNSSELAVNLGITHEERAERLEALTRCYLNLFEESKNRPEWKEPIQNAQRMLDKAEKEIKEEPNPDPSRVQRYLILAKDALKALAFGRETQEALKKLWDLFNLGS